MMSLVLLLAKLLVWEEELLELNESTRIVLNEKEVNCEAVGESDYVEMTDKAQRKMVSKKKQDSDAASVEATKRN